MQTQYVDMTPEMAAEYLRRNPSNRAIRPAVVRSLVAAIAAGEWVVNHQGIAVDVNGNLQDGQHRLLAIAQSGKTVPILVTTGAPLDAFKVIDQGAKRSTADVLMLKPQYASTIGVIARWYKRSGDKRVTPEILVKLNEVFGGLAIEVYDYAPSSVRFFASSVMRAVAIARIVSGADKQYVMDLYRSLATVDFGNFPPIAHSFAAQIARGEIRNSNENYDFPARCWRLLDEKRQGAKKLIVPNAKADMALICTAIKDHIEDTLGYMP